MKIAADMHTHTIASTHAYSTILENSVIAAERGIKAIAMTDHASTMQDAPNIWHFHNIGVLPRTLNGVTIIRGAEANVIDLDGNIDLDRYTLDRLEWIIASMHRPCINPGSVEENTNAYIKLAQNSDVDVIGHPTTNEFVWDYEKGLKAIKEYGKIIELNESSICVRKGALENARDLLKICKRYEIPVCINTDSHFCYKIGLTPVAFELVKEIDFPHDLIFNLEIDRVMDHIKNKHSID